MHAYRIFALALAAVLFSGNSANAEELLAGIGVADISPDTEKMHVPLGGYGERENKPAVGIHDSTMAKAMILKQGDKKFALVTVDLLGIVRSLREEVLKRIVDTGIKSENLMLAASHTHGSVEMNAMHRGNVFGNKFIGIFDEKLLLFTADRIAEAIKKADEKYAPVKTGVASAQIPGFNRNRRGDEITDNEMTILRVDAMDGKPLAVFVNYTAHPTYTSGKTMHLTADWPGYLQREIETHLGGGVVAMYANGAEGDVAPSGGQGPSDFARAEDYGRKLSIKAMELIPLIKTSAETELDYSMTDLKLPPRKVPPSLMDSAGKEYGLTEENLEMMLKAMNPDSSYLGVFRVGGLVGIGIPGEMITALGLQIKDAVRKSGAKHPIIVGLANEWISYILTPDEYHQGGYEPGVSFYGETLGPVIVEQAIEAGKKIVPGQ